MSCGCEMAAGVGLSAGWVLQGQCCALPLLLSCCSYTLPCTSIRPPTPPP